MGTFGNKEWKDMEVNILPEYKKVFYNFKQVVLDDLSKQVYSKTLGCIVSEMQFRFVQRMANNHNRTMSDILRKMIANAMIREFQRKLPVEEIEFL